MRTFAILLGVTLAAYVGTIGAITPMIRADAALEKAACGWFLMCANDIVVEDALAQFWSVEPDAAEAAVAGFSEALSRAPTDSNRWCDLGEALLRSGSPDEAKYCFEQALRFAPHSPPVLVRAAYFHDEIDELDESQLLFKHVLELTRDYDAMVFGYFGRVGTPVESVISRAIPPLAEPLTAYFRHQVRRADVDDLPIIWQEVSERGLADSQLLTEYVRRLLAEEQLELAVEVQAAYLGELSDDWPERNIIVNSGFEREFLDTELGWRISRRDGVTIDRIQGDAHTGSFSLRIEFGGEENVNFRNVAQLFVARSGRYRCSASVRSDGLTTDQGMFLRIYDVKDRRRLDVRTEAVSGTTEWKQMETAFSVRGETRLLRLEVVRTPSRMFDNKIAGSIWFDDVGCALASR